MTAVSQSQTTTTTLKKVCVVGPECTGKTELSHFLADHFRTACVEEYARPYLDNLNRPYDQSDLVKIAHGQVRMEDEWMNEANRILICDTNLIVIKVWSEFKFGNCDSEILRLMSSRSYDLFLLTYIDVPWQDDPLREHPDRREELFAIYLREMKGQPVIYVEVRGSINERHQTAIDAIGKYLQV